MGEVQPPAGEFGQTQIALDHDDLGFAGNAGEAEPGRHFAGVHVAAGGEARLFRMLDDHQREGRGVLQRPAHDPGVGDGAHAVGEGDRAGLGEHAHFRQLAAFEALRHRGVGVDLGEAEQPRAPGDELDHRHVVDDRLRVGQADHRRDPAGGRRPPARSERALVLLARLAQLDADVDQPGTEAVAVAVDHFGAFGHAFGEQVRADRGDQLALAQQAAGRVEPSSPDPAVWR